MNRREIVETLFRGAASAPSSISPASLAAGRGEDSSCLCERPATGPKADYFPNVLVETHDQRRAWFYDDLLANKTVMVNFMSVAHHHHYPVTRNLLRVQRLLGKRLGKDIFMYSITTEPQKDTPAVLREFARGLGVGPGWLFLSGEPENLQLLRDRFFVRRGFEEGSGHDAQDCSLGLVRYGNEAVGVWGSVPARSDPEWIVKRLDWVRSRSQPSIVVPRRKGPPPLAGT